MTGLHRLLESEHDYELCERGKKTYVTRYTEDKYGNRQQWVGYELCEQGETQAFRDEPPERYVMVYVPPVWINNLIEEF